MFESHEYGMFGHAGWFLRGDSFKVCVRTFDP
jgi:hypothetical protein